MSLRIRNVSFGEFSKVDAIGQNLTNKNSSGESQVQQKAEVKNSEAVSKPVQSKTSDIVDLSTKNNKINPTYVSVGVSALSLGLAAVAIAKNRKIGKFSSEVESNVSQLSGKLNEISENISNLINRTKSVDRKVSNVSRQAKITEAKVDNIETDISQKAKWYDSYLSAQDDKIARIQNAEALRVAPIERNIAIVDDMKLLQNLDNNGQRIKPKAEVVEWIQSAAQKYIKNTDGIANPKPLSTDASVWSLTVESIPEKEGGLGEVPVQIAKNLTHVFGADNYLVRPIIISKGKSQLINVDGQFQYLYNLDKAKPWKMDVDKIAEFDTQVFRNGRIETQKVSVFTGEDPEFKYKRLMFFNPDYNVTPGGLYKSSEKVSETERFAFFAKNVYEFAKLKLDPNSISNYKILNKVKYDEVKTPQAMILNDWHAAAMAPLARFKAPCEASSGELSKDAAEALRTMNFVNINHNLDYQGKEYAHRSEILNTLFDKYTLDIYENAFTKFVEDNEAKTPMQGITNVLMTDNSVNLANMAACLSNKMKPVSPTYAKEVAEQAERSVSMRHVCEERLAHGTMEGASNGWDRSVNEVSIKRIGGFNDAVNNDKISIFRAKIKSIAGLAKADKDAVTEILSRGVTAHSMGIRIAELASLKNESINSVLKELEKSGVTNLRKFEDYTSADPTDKIMLRRKNNKRMFIDFLNSMIEHGKSKKDGMFNIGELDKTSLAHIKPDMLDDIMVMDMGVRFVSQKGVDIACDAIERVLTNWEKHYPNKPKPIIVLGGVDAEGGAINKFVKQLKTKLGKEKGKQVVWQQGYTPNNIYQAGSDFTLYSSHFEPDGAKWESLYKGTPVICTRVGGHVDSVNDGVNGFLTSRTVPEIKAVTKDDHDAYVKEMGKDFADAIWRAAETFYGKNDEYAKMVRQTIDGDQSWIIKDASGEIKGGALLGHMRDLGFNPADFDTSKIKEV